MPSIEWVAGREGHWRILLLVPMVFLSLLHEAKAQESSQPAPPSISSPSLPPLPPVPRAPLVQPAFSVVIDAAHGGVDQGARFSEEILEKDLTLALAVRLRSALAARAITVITTRESDVEMSALHRAETANHALAGACLLLHATASGSGVHLFTSSVAAQAASSGQVVSWATAQAAWVNRSLRFASELNSALGQAGIPVTLGSTSLRPLDNLTCPAVAVEIGPRAVSSAGNARPASDADYQQRILAALSAGLLEWSVDWKQQP